jgi:uncharacterized membrane protein YfcA
LILTNLALPSKDRPSPLGITKCSGWFWLIECSFIAFCGVMVAVAVIMIRKEQDLKLKYGGINIVESDIIYNQRNTVILICLGFFGGLFAGALGLGGGSIFNPVLLTMGIPP